MRLFTFSLINFVLTCSLLVHGKGFFVHMNLVELRRYDYLKVIVEPEVSNAIMVLYREHGEVADLLGRYYIEPVSRNGKSVFLFIPRYGMPYGTYELKLILSNKVIFETNIVFLSRLERNIDTFLKILTFEDNIDIRNYKDFFTNSSFSKVPYKSNPYKLSADMIMEVMRKLRLNTFFMLGGQTSGLVKDKHIGVWNIRPINNTRVLEYLKREGFFTGVYVMNYLVLGYEKLNIKGYRPSLVFRGGRLERSKKFISPILSPKRKDDIIEILTKLGKKEYIDFIGMDFVRFGDYAGYEVFDDFSKEILSLLPLGYNFDSIESFARAVAKYRELRKLFNWYLCKRISLIVNNITLALRSRGIYKPIFVFMLGWNAGRDHGQDPIMFKDAGVDYFLYMLYETKTKKIFDDMGKYWFKKVYNDEINIVFGNIVDSYLNYSSVFRPPEEFRYRILKAMKDFSYFPPKGFFIHDLSRMLKGRLGKYSAEEWFFEIEKFVRGLNINYNH